MRNIRKFGEAGGRDGRQLGAVSAMSMSVRERGQSMLHRPNRRRGISAQAELLVRYPPACLLTGVPRRIRVAIVRAPWLWEASRSR